MTQGAVGLPVSASAIFAASPSAVAYFGLGTLVLNLTLAVNHRFVRHRAR